MVRALGRGSALPRGTHPWDLKSGFPDEALEGVDVVVHLYGFVGQRWTEKHKEAILNSRIQSTSSENPLARGRICGTWIQASAIGIYGIIRRPAAKHTNGHGLLGRGGASLGASILGGGCDAFVSLVRMRLGLVLSPNGGTLDKLLPIYKLGLGALWVPHPAHGLDSH